MPASPAIAVPHPEVPPPQLALMRCRVRFRPSSAKEAPGDAIRVPGSQWRGGFGHALRRSVCVTGLPECSRCPLVDACAYPRLFEHRTPTTAKKLARYPRTPNPYVLEPSDGKFDTGTERSALGVTLLGGSTDDLELVVRALARAAADGFGAKRAALVLHETHVEERTAGGTAWRAWRANAPSRPAATLTPVAPPVPDRVRVHLVSPLRIRRRGKPVGPADFDLRAFAANVLRRISLLTYFFGATPLETDFARLLRHAESSSITGVRLCWRDGARYSSRQGRRIPVGGIVGSFDVDAADLAPIWPCLWLGQWTHIGKGCTLGLGRYVLESLDGSSNLAGPCRL